MNFGVENKRIGRSGRKVAIRASIAAAIALGFATDAAAEDLSILPEWARVERPPARKALVIGLRDYDQARGLPTPSYDAKIMAKTLSALNFQIYPVDTNRLEYEALFDTIDGFALSLQPGDIALVFYSGHGLNRDGEDYLIPSDKGAVPAGRERYEYLPVNHIVDDLTRAQAAVAIILLDACRSAPFDTTQPEPSVFHPPRPPRVPRSGKTPVAPDPSAPDAATSVDAQQPEQRDAGLAAIKLPPAGIVAGFAAKVGFPAYSLLENESPAKGSLYTRAVSQSLMDPDNDFAGVLGEAFAVVGGETGDQQLPWSEVGGTMAFYLASGQEQQDKEADRWILLVQQGDDDTLPSLLDQYIRRFPTSRFAFAAKNKIAALAAARLALASKTPVGAAQPTPLASNPAPSAVALGPATTVLSGSLEPAAISNKDAAFTAVAAKTTNLYSRASAPFSLFEDRGVAPVAKGSALHVLQYLPEQKAAKVMSEMGQIGFVRDVFQKIARPVVLETKYVIGSGASPFSAEQLAYLKSQLGKAGQTFILTVGPATAKFAGIAPQLQFDRALETRSQLIKLGIPPNRLKLEFDNQATADSAQLQVAE